MSRLAVLLNIWGLAVHLGKCIQVVDNKKNEIPDYYVPILVAAEDHRAFYHYGVDPIGILRALYVRFFRREIQGASTIEQQFVRVVTERYERTVSRKLKEQLLAIAISRAKCKADIARAYLAIAYYGASYKCHDGIQKLINNHACATQNDHIISVVARLKYPEPAVHTNIWKSKFERRISYIGSRTGVKANKAINPVRFAHWTRKSYAFLTD